MTIYRMNFCKGCKSIAPFHFIGCKRGDIELFRMFHKVPGPDRHKGRFCLFQWLSQLGLLSGCACPLVIGELLLMGLLLSFFFFASADDQQDEADHKSDDTDRAGGFDCYNKEFS